MSEVQAFVQAFVDGTRDFECNHCRALTEAERESMITKTRRDIEESNDEHFIAMQSIWLESLEAGDVRKVIHKAHAYEF